MSKSVYHTSVLHDVECLPVEEIQDRYGIEIDEDGVVWDPCEYKEFPTLLEWAVYMDEQNDDGASKYVVKTNSRSRYSDDY